MAELQHRSKKGFAGMDPEKQRQIASKGGKRAHELGTAHRYDSISAKEAGIKGGAAKHRTRYTPPSVTDQELRNELMRAEAAGDARTAHLCRCALRLAVRPRTLRSVHHLRARQRIADLLADRQLALNIQQAHAALQKIGQDVEDRCVDVLLNRTPDARRKAVTL